VLVFLGLPAAEESEGFDRTSIELPANQIALLEALAQVHDRLIVVLANGGVVAVSGWQDKVAAVLECWLSGQAAGGAVVDLLLGVANPSGKLAETIPVRLQDNSAHLNFPGDSGVVRYGEGMFIGYRGYDARLQDVSHPFGYGLSYTTFEISDLQLAHQGSVAGGDLAVEAAVTVTNTGPLAGAEVVQLYVCDVATTASRPIRELKGFAKVWLEPGESQRVQIPLDERSFAFWSVRLGRWVVEAGEFEIAVGSSSRHLDVSRRIHIDAPSIAPPLTADSTLQEWLADGLGGTALGELAPVLADTELLKMIGTMPLSTLAAFGKGLVHQKVETLLQDLLGS
jgi:beta-glucosidase